MMSAAKSRASGLSVGKNSTMQSQSFSSCQYGSKSSLRFVLKIARSPSSFTLPTPKLAVQERYNQSLHLGVSSRSLQGIAERPLPCNYYVIFHGGNTGSNPLGDASLEPTTSSRCPPKS